MHKSQCTPSCVLLSSSPDRCAYKPNTVYLIKGWSHNANQIHVQILTTGSGPVLLRSEPHPLPWTCRNHRIWLWVVLLLNQTHNHKCTQGVLLSSPWCPWGWQQQQAELLPPWEVGRLLRAAPRGRHFDPAVSGVNSAQIRAGSTMPCSSEALFSSQQLPTFQKEYQPDINATWCCTWLWPCYTLKAGIYLALGSGMMKMRSKGSVLPLLVDEHCSHKNCDSRRVLFACMWRAQVHSHGLGAS